MAHHTHTDTCTQRYTQIQVSFVHFTLFGSFGIHAKDTNFIFGIPQTYTCTDTQTCTHMDTHMYRDIDTQIQICRDICMFVYKHTHTHRCAWGKYKEIVSSNPLFKSKLTKIVTLNIKFEEIVT